MSAESSKTRRLRGPEFARKYLQGRVIDIGCGPDLIVPHAEPFDVEHGDAQLIATLRPTGAYDAVCSSHCLEHMRDVPAALAQWWSLVRPGGYLVLVVPDEDLYEQGGWPSLFNPDHKATFRLHSSSSWSPVSYDIAELAGALPNAEILSCERQDAGYEHALRKSSLSAIDRGLFFAQGVSNELLRRAHVSEANWLRRTVNGAFRRVGTPIDQTLGPALAQIQVIAKKTA